MSQLRMSFLALLVCATSGCGSDAPFADDDPPRGPVQQLDSGFNPNWSDAQTPGGKAINGGPMGFGAAVDDENTLLVSYQGTSALKMFYQANRDEEWREEERKRNVWAENGVDLTTWKGKVYLGAWFGGVELTGQGIYVSEFDPVENEFKTGVAISDETAFAITIVGAGDTLHLFYTTAKPGKEGPLLHRTCTSNCVIGSSWSQPGTPAANVRATRSGLRSTYAPWIDTIFLVRQSSKDEVWAIATYHRSNYTAAGTGFKFGIGAIGFDVATYGVNSIAMVEVAKDKQMNWIIAPTWSEGQPNLNWELFTGMTDEGGNVISSNAQPALVTDAYGRTHVAYTNSSKKVQVRSAL